MSEDIEKINEIFGSPDSGEQNQGQKKKRKKRVNALDKLLTEEDGEQQTNYTGDAESERDFMPVRQNHESRTGCLGGIMYFTFVVCVSIILACFMWMAASDMLALNQTAFTAEITLPSTAFTYESVETVNADGTVRTTIVTHADIDYVASELKQAGIIQYEWLFRFFCGISHADTKLDAGTYTISSTYDYRALVHNMQAGAGLAATVMVTIPEGFTMRQIFERLEENYVCSYDDLMEAAANYNYNYSFLDESSLGDATRLEGYLFPDTYEFYVNMQASSVLNKFLDNFNTRMTSKLRADAEERGVSFNEVIIIASLIEREAANDDERDVIASVIYNRLKEGMALGLESGILYLHPEHEGAATAEMIREDSPYNLLISTSLPPTAISNPGMASIQAALYPATTKYLFFTLDTESGTHRFFTNYEDFTAFAATQNYGG